MAAPPRHRRQLPDSQGVDTRRSTEVLVVADVDNGPVARGRRRLSVEATAREVRVLVDAYRDRDDTLAGLCIGMQHNPQMEDLFWEQVRAIESPTAAAERATGSCHDAHQAVIQECESRLREIEATRKVLATRREQTRAQLDGIERRLGVMRRRRAEEAEMDGAGRQARTVEVSGPISTDISQLERRALQDEVALRDATKAHARNDATLEASERHHWALAVELRAHDAAVAALHGSLCLLAGFFESSGDRRSHPDGIGHAELLYLDTLRRLVEEVDEGRQQLAEILDP